MFRLARAETAGRFRNWHASVFGWVGAEDRHVCKYTSMFAVAGIADSVRCVAPFTDILFRPKRVRALAEQWLMLLENDFPNRPGVALFASNGGAVVYGHAVRLLTEDCSLPLPQRRFSNVTLAATVFDSSPVKRDPYAVAEVVASMVPPSFRQAARTITPHIAKLLPMPIPLFDILRDDPASASQLFVYSPNDKITAADHVAALVVARRQSHRGGASCVHELVTAAQHCSHLREEPVAYTKAIDALLEQAASRRDEIARQ